MHTSLLAHRAVRILIGLAPLISVACATTPNYGVTPAGQTPYTQVSSNTSTTAEAAPRPEAAQSTASRAVNHALQMVGKPYRYGGSTPASGFDCSGLVYFSFRQAGALVPRTTDEQRRASRLIRVSSLRRGDLLFFDHEGKKNSHVGIYLGDGDFVHAPSSTKHVRTDALDSRYWRKHLSEARRIDL